MQVTWDFCPFRGKFLGRYGNTAIITPLWTPLLLSPTSRNRP